MQSAADFHNEISRSFFQKSDGFLDDAASLDAAVDMLDPDPKTGDLPVRLFLLQAQLPASWLALRHDDLDSPRLKGKEAKILQKHAAFGQRVGSGIGNLLVMPLALMGGAQEEDLEVVVDHNEVLDRMALLLSAVEQGLLIGIFGALDTSLGSIMAKEGWGLQGSQLLRQIRQGSAGYMPQADQCRAKNRQKHMDPDAALGLAHPEHASITINPKQVSFVDGQAQLEATIFQPGQSVAIYCDTGDVCNFSNRFNIAPPEPVVASDTGSVLSYSGEPLSGIQVSLVNSSSGATFASQPTNDTGIYELQNVGDGKFYIWSAELRSPPRLLSRQEPCGEWIKDSGR